MASWKISFYGAFRVWDPSGEPVTLPRKKSQILVALLAIHRKSPLERDGLAGLLWPDRPLNKQLQSLRREIACVRAVFGREGVETSRTHCWLSSSLQIETDLAQGAKVSASEFMPGFDRRLFEGASYVSEEPGPVEIFGDLLEYYSRSNPDRMLALMRENLTLTLGLGAETHSKLLNRVQGRSRYQIWKQFFDGFLLMGAGNIPMASAQMKGVVGQAGLDNDRLLAVQAGVQLCIGYYMRNRESEASQILDHCRSLATGSRSGSLLPTAIQAQGSFQISRGNVKGGVALLEKAEGMYQDPIDAAVMRSLRGFFLSTIGECSLAESLITEPMRIADQTGHQFIKSFCALTQGVIMIHGSAPSNCVPVIESIVQSVAAFGNNQIAISATELLSIAYRRAGERVASEQAMNRARRERMRMGMLLTPWNLRFQAIAS